MIIPPVSSLEAIHAALSSQNPFAKPPYLNASDVWGQEFFDVETINAHASDAVFEALEQIREGQYSTTSIAITAQDGTGKTHIISRIRHRLQNQGGGLFVYANKYGNIRQIKPEFQRILAESLGRIGMGGVTQWQKLATEMTNHAVKAVKSNASASYSPEDLVKKFETSNPDDVKKWIKDLTRAFLKAKKVSDPDIVKAIFWTLSEEQSLYAIKWLQGQELAQYKSEELQLPSQSQSFETVLQILDLISEYNELVICFDELDSPDAYDDISGLHLSQVIASFIKDLLQNLSRGVILSVMMPTQWTDKIKQLPGGVYNKVSAQGKPIILRYMDGASIQDLVTAWLKKYYEFHDLVPLHPLYPFTDSQIYELGKGKATVREVLKWCRENCKPPTELNTISKIEDQERECANAVEVAFTQELEDDWGNYLENTALLADALLFGFQTLVGQTIERVTIEAVTEKVKKRGGKDDYINFKIIGKENEKSICIGVAVLQQTNGRTLGAALRRLMDYQQFGLTRGCLVRSQAKKITTYIEQNYLEPLIREQGGEFIPLKEEEIKPLIAIRAVHQKREVDYGVSEADIFQFIAEQGTEKMLGISNPLLAEILSDPSYQVPTDMIEDEPVAVAESIVADLSNFEGMKEELETMDLLS